MGERERERERKREREREREREERTTKQQSLKSSHSMQRVCKEYVNYGRRIVECL